MNTPHGAEPLPAGFVRLVSSIRYHSEPERLIDVLNGGNGPFANGSIERSTVRGLRRYAVDLRLRLGTESTGITTFSKAAYVDLGAPRRSTHGWVVEIGWRAVGAVPLFPVFSGWLRVGADELRTDGIYAPPGGAIGRIADRLLLHLAANATASWLLREIDHAARGAAA